MSENNMQGDRGRPKTRIGTVLSNKMTKTVVVQVERRAKHGQYGKYMTEKKKYKVHDEQQAAKPGQTRFCFSPRSCAAPCCCPSSA